MVEIIGILALILLGSIPLLYRMHKQGKVNIDKPEKRTYIFENEEGEKYNPFEGPDEEDDDEWRYSPDRF